MSEERLVELRVEPNHVLVDDPVRISASGLKPGQSVTVFSELTNDGGVFIAHAHYVADIRGTLDLSNAESLGGSYTGIEPMGLFWAMQAAPGQKNGLRLFKRDVKEPLVVELSITDGHLNPTSRDDIPASYNVNPTSHNINYNHVTHDNGSNGTNSQEPVLAKTTVKRFYQASDVREIPVQTGSIRGSIFLPPGSGPFPAVMDMFGTAGGLIKMRAALLASRGFLTFALPFFGYEDLPENIDIDLHYFEEAIEWLYSHPLTLRQVGIGVIGVSKGASLALHCATISNNVKAVVSLNGYCCHSFGNHRYGNVQLPVVNPILNEIEETDEGIVYGKAMTYRPHIHLPALIPIERTGHASLLLVRGLDDPSCDPTHVDVLVDRLRASGLNNYRVLDYPGAGHLIEPPHTPLCRVCYTKIIKNVVVYGGQAKEHARAQEHSWAEILHFFRQQLLVNNALDTR